MPSNSSRCVNKTKSACWLQCQRKISFLAAAIKGHIISIIGVSRPLWGRKSKRIYLPIVNRTRSGLARALFPKNYPAPKINYLAITIKTEKLLFEYNAISTENIKAVNIIFFRVPQTIWDKNQFTIIMTK